MKSRIARLASVLGLCTVACGAHHGLPPDTVRLDHGQRSEADRYLPLNDGYVYVYRTHSQSSGDGVMTIQVEHTDATHVRIEFGGRRDSLVVDATGIRYSDSGYWLKAPLSLDNSWDGRYGVVRIVGRDVEVTVPAGHFTGCLKTEEHDRTQTGTVMTSIFCPEVGMVSLDVRSKASSETATLTTFGPRADPLVGVAPPTEQ